VELLVAEANHVSVADVVRLYVADRPEPELLRRAAGLATLPTSWRDYFLRQLQAAS
jgi:hypothetical protein